MRMNRAYIFNGDLAELFKFKKELAKAYAKDVSAVLESLKESKVGKMNAGRDIGALRMQKLCKNKTIGELQHYELCEILESIAQMQMSAPFDFAASVMMYHCENTMILQFIGIPFLYKDSKKLLARHVKKGTLKDFHYQDQADKPEEITRKEWDFRKRIWKKIWKDVSRYSQAGFAFDLHSFLWNICYERDQLKQKPSSLH